jgi:DNA-directed RNA polymerase delta subunit
MNQMERQKNTALAYLQDVRRAFRINIMRYVGEMHPDIKSNFGFYLTELEREGKIIKLGNGEWGINPYRPFCLRFN